MAEQFANDSSRLAEEINTSFGDYFSDPSGFTDKLIAATEKAAIEMIKERIGMHFG